MDVLSLLNSNTNADEQHKVVDSSPSKTPSRNRTPWDAGGYSLPIHTAFTGSEPPQQQIQHDIQYDDSHIGSPPQSPKHNFSDSRSSFSSFTSSIRSAKTTHSRFSSTSTINSNFHPANNFSTDSTSPKSRIMSQGFEFPDPCLSINSHQASNESPPCASPSSARYSMERLSLVEEDQSEHKPDSLTYKDITTAIDLDMNRKVSDNSSGNVFPERPSSPSDAVLIKRSIIPALRVNTRDEELNRTAQLPNHLSAVMGSQPSSLLQVKGHKRTVSAPDFGISRPLTTPDLFAPTFSAVMYDVTKTKALGPKAEPTPPSSYHPDDASPRSPHSYTFRDAASNVVSADESQTIVCMYIPNCDTGSQMRKAISHIFGRNKMCTRLIPQHVWVHYCRKHYQRSRYRNPKEYAKLQCDLVQEQIRRVHMWSEDNSRRGLPGVVRDWGLAIRKREQKRLDDLASTNRKRPAPTLDPNDSDDEGNSDLGRVNSVPVTAVPTWLLQKCHQRYTTHDICNIFNVLHQQILDDEVPCFPDLEILPNILVDNNEPKSPKSYNKRTPASIGHRRSQSLGVAINASYNSQDRRLSQTSVRGHESFILDQPIQKRQRPNGCNEDFTEHLLPQFSRPRLVEQSLDTGRRIQLPHRPTFPDIDEHHEYGEAHAIPTYYARSPGSYEATLPAPAAQRARIQSMATYLESSNGHSRRPSHSRSQSDMSTFIRGHQALSASTSSTYNLDSNRDFLSPRHQVTDYAVSTDYTEIPPQHREGPRPSTCKMNHYTRKHNRHQSTPMIQSSCSTPTSLYRRETPCPNYGHPHNHKSLPSPVGVSRVTESHEAQALYIARR